MDKQIVISVANVAKSTSEKYDNVGAYKQLQVMMKRGDKLSVKCFTDKEGHTSLWIESKKVAGFKYIVRAETLGGLIHYLQTGEATDFDLHPDNFIPEKEEDFDFQLWILKFFVEQGHVIQYVPLFREYNDKISGNIPMLKGSIFFRITRSEDNLEYLRENKQIA